MSNPDLQAPSAVLDEPDCEATERQQFDVPAPLAKEFSELVNAMLAIPDNAALMTRLPENMQDVIRIRKQQFERFLMMAKANGLEGSLVQALKLVDQDLEAGVVDIFKLRDWVMRCYDALVAMPEYKEYTISKYKPRVQAARCRTMLARIEHVCSNAKNLANQQDATLFDRKRERALDIAAELLDIVEEGEIPRELSDEARACADNINKRFDDMWNLGKLEAALQMAERFGVAGNRGLFNLYSLKAEEQAARLGVRLKVVRDRLRPYSQKFASSR